MFGQLSNRESLRDLIVALEAHRGKCYFLGMGKHNTRNNLAKANENRDCRIFEGFAYRMIVSISLTDKTPLNDLFDETDYHDVKEQNNNCELLLF